MVLNTMGIRTIILGFVVSSFGLQPVGAQDRDVVVARRIAATTAAALQEYAAGVDIDGRIVSRSELDESTSLLAEAGRKVNELSPQLQALTTPWLEGIAAAMRARRAPAELQSLFWQMRRKLEVTLMAELDPLPSVPPSLTRSSEDFRS